MLLCDLLDHWMEHTDELSSPRTRKLCALALCHLLLLPSEAPLLYFDQVLACVTGEGRRSGGSGGLGGS